MNPDTSHPVQSTDYTPNRDQQPKKYLPIINEVWENGRLRKRVQVVRHKDGFKLPHRTTKAIVRSVKSPTSFMGAKQLAKLEKKSNQSKS